MAGSFFTFGDETIYLFGTDGNDTLSAGFGNHAIDLLGGNDVATVAGGSGGINMGDGDDTLWCGSQIGPIKDPFVGYNIQLGNGNNVAHLAKGGTEGLLALYGGDGSDSVTGDSEVSLNRFISVGSGNNFVQIGNSPAMATADPWASHINGVWGTPVWDFDPNLVVHSGFGADTLIAGDGDISFSSDGGKDVMRMGNGKHKIAFGDGEIDVKIGDGNFLIQIIDSTYNGQNNFSIGNGNGYVSLGAGKNSVSTEYGLVSIWGYDHAGLSGVGDDTVVVKGNSDVIGTEDDAAIVDIRLGTGEDNITVTTPSQIYILLIADLQSDTVSVGDLWGRNQIRLAEAGAGVPSAGSLVKVGNILNVPVAGEGYSYGSGMHLPQAQLTLATGTGNDSVHIGDNLFDRPTSYLEEFPYIFTNQSSTVVNTGWGDDTLSVGNGAWHIGTWAASPGVGTDNDLVTVGTGKYRTIHLGEGIDTLTMGDELALFSITSYGSDADVLSPNYDIIKLGNGNGSLNLINGNAKVSYGIGDVTLTGGNGELIVDTPSKLTINWSAGRVVAIGNADDDRVTVGGGNHEIYLGAGNNLTYMSGLGSVNVAGGSGNDSFVGSADGVLSLQLQDGNNYMMVGSGAQYVWVGAGNDYFSSLESSNGDVDMGDGDNTVNYRGPTNSLTKTGNGNDVISIASIQGSMAVLTGDGNDRVYVLDNGGALFVNLAGGNNSITAPVGAPSFNIQGLDGNNQIILGSAPAIGVILGNGTNTVSVGEGELYMELGNGGNSVSVESALGNSYIQTGIGNDQITVNGGAAQVFGSSGTNSFVLNGGQITVSGGNDTDSVSVTGGNQSVFLGNGINYTYVYNGAAVVNTGGNTDYFAVFGGTAAIGSGDGNDHFEIHAGAASFYAADGDDGVNIHAGDATINGGNGADIIHQWGGNAVITGGSGADYFSYQCNAGSVAGGTVTITDYEVGVDVLAINTGGVTPTLIIGANAVTYDFGGTEVLTIIGTNDPNLITITWG